jgi:hypothetical protein
MEHHVDEKKKLEIYVLMVFVCQLVVIINMLRMQLKMSVVFVMDKIKLAD